tara:strand:- start:279 stop:812 length:534 start_codon:yes stop_codon:yes gene_type:complete
MEDTTDQQNWEPIEGLPKQRRVGPGTSFATKRADHRNAILKDWGKRLEPQIKPEVPIDYISPFDRDKCAYCLSNNIGPSGDEFRPCSQRGRINKVNCIPCCGRCNSSKQDKCGSALIEWIKARCSNDQQDKLINWYKANEKYLIIPLDTFDNKINKTYSERFNELDTDLNKIYEMFS